MRDELTLQLFAFRNVEIYSLIWPLFPIINVNINEELSRALTKPGTEFTMLRLQGDHRGLRKVAACADRKNASHDAFRVRPIPNHYVRNPIPAIVIDDVATSGTTLTAAVSQLLLSGVHVTGCAAIAGTGKL